MVNSPWKFCSALSRKLWTQKMSLWCFISAVVFSAGIAFGQTERPNIIVIYTDDMNMEDLGAFGGEVLTPNIDALVAEGAKLVNYYAAAPVCTPSRYGLLTGRYASRSLALQVDYPATGPAFLRWNTHILPGDQTVAHILKAQGYVTGMVGKYHNIDNEAMQEYCDELDGESNPDVMRCIQKNYIMLQDHIKRITGFEYAESLYANNLHALGLPKALRFHNMEWVTQGALNFLEQHRSEPYFLYVATTIPHGPPPVASMKADPRITPMGYLENPPDVQPERESVFQRVSAAGLPEEAAVYTWLDDAVGAIRDKLKETGLAENTLIILASDHSGAFGGRGKMTLYEGGIHTPALMWWPGKIPANSVVDGLAANVDIVPTIFDAAGISPPEYYVVDGVSLLPMATGQQEQVREDLFLEITYTRGILSGSWKYVAIRFPDYIENQITPENTEAFNQEGLAATEDVIHGTMRSRYNAHELYPGYFDRDQLYNLATDKREQRNLASDPQYADTLKSLQNKLSEYLAKFPHRFGEFKE